MNLSHWWIDTVTYATTMAIVDGDVTVSATATALGRWEEMFKVIGMGGGQEGSIFHQFATETDIAIGTLVWGPGADTGDRNESYRVMTREYARLQNGSYSYYILGLGR
jgi:hypothetical protein